MDAFLNMFTVSKTYTFGVEEIAVTILLPFVLMFGVGFTYNRTQDPSQFNPQFLRGMFIIAPVISLTTLTIIGNPAVALGMVGALSIMRFRTAVKSPLDATFVFWSIAIGIACGAGYYLAATLLMLMCGGFLMLLTLIGYGNPKEAESLVKVNLDSGAPGEVLVAIEGSIKAATRSLERISTLSTSETDTKALTYLVKTRKGFDPAKLIAELKAHVGVRNIQFLGSDSSLPV